MTNNPLLAAHDKMGFKIDGELLGLDLARTSHKALNTAEFGEQQPACQPYPASCFLHRVLAGDRSSAGSSCTAQPSQIQAMAHLKLSH